MLSARNPNATPNPTTNGNRSFRCVIERCHALCSTQESLVNHFLAQHIPVRRSQLSEDVYCGWEGCEQLTNLTHFTVSGLVRHYQQHLQAEYGTPLEAVQKVGESEEEGDETSAVVTPKPLKDLMEWEITPVVVRATPIVQVVAASPTPTATTALRVVAIPKLPPSPPLARISPPRTARPLSPDQIKCRFGACAWHQDRNVEGAEAPLTRLLNHVFMHHAGGGKDPYEDGARPCLWGGCPMVRWMPEMEAVRYHLTKHAMEGLGAREFGEFGEVNSA